MFSGIGGFALGAYKAEWRFDNHYFSEVDEYAIKVYKQRFPDAIELGDITKLYPSKLPMGQWIITGGFPCQDISIASKGEGIEGKRSGLWFEMWRIIGDIRPRFVIAENVGAITFRGLDRVLSSLAEIGYDAEWQDIRASDMGAPHRRERIWIVAYPAGIGRNWSQGKMFSEILAQGLYSDNERGAWRGMCKYRGSLSGRLRPFPDARVFEMAHGIPSRVDRLKCLGNSIVPQIAEILFKQIGESWQ